MVILGGGGGGGGWGGEGGGGGGGGGGRMPRMPLPLYETCVENSVHNASSNFIVY